jgi:hypothetical protein
MTKVPRRILLAAAATFVSALAAATARAETSMTGAADAEGGRPQWGLGAGGGGFWDGGGAHAGWGLETSLWLTTNAPTRALGLDLGGTTKAFYAEVQTAIGVGGAHDGEVLLGVGAGPVYDRADGRWGAQTTAWVALAPCFIFPFVRLEKFGADEAHVSAGLMTKILLPAYTHHRP